MACCRNSPVMRCGATVSGSCFRWCSCGDGGACSWLPGFGVLGPAEERPQEDPDRAVKILRVSVRELCGTSSRTKMALGPIFHKDLNAQ